MRGGATLVSALLAIGLACVGCASSGAGERDRVPVTDTRDCVVEVCNDLVVALDVSERMRLDWGDGSLLAHQLGLARDVVAAVDPARTAIGVVTYAGSSWEGVGRPGPLTRVELTPGNDFHRVLALLDEIEGRGTRGLPAAPAGLEQSAAALLPQGRERRPSHPHRSVLLFSGGLPGPAASGSDARYQLELASWQLARARLAFITTFVLVLGPDAPRLASWEHDVSRQGGFLVCAGQPAELADARARVLRWLSALEHRLDAPKLDGISGC